MPKSWVKEKITRIKKKTSIGNSRLSDGAGTNKNQRRKKIEGKVNKNLQIIYLTKIINNMIKRTEISQQKTPTVTKNKN